QRLRLGILAGCLLAVGSLNLAAQAPRQADPTLQAQVLAVFEKNDKLLVHATLTPAPKKTTSALPQLEVLDKNKQIVARAAQVTRFADAPGSFRFELNVAKEKAAYLTLRCRSEGRYPDVPLRNVLLAKARETALAASQGFD